MNLAKFALKNYQVSMVALFMLVILGLMSLMTMPRSDDPQFDFPASVIKVVYPGTNPLDMEKLVVDPIEASLSELEDIKEMFAQIEDGLAVIRLEFIYGSDSEDKYDKVVTALSRIRDQLPDGIQHFAIEKVSPTDTNILQYALTADPMDYRQARYLAEKLEKRLRPLSGVKKVESVAIPDQQLQVRANIPRMQALGISMNQLIQAVESSSGNIPAGHVNAGQRRFTVRTSGDFDSVQQLQRTVVNQGKQLVYVQDIADVSIDSGIPNYLAKHNGKPAVFINVVQRKGTNIFNVKQGVSQEIADFSAQQLPKNFNIELVHDQSRDVEQRLNGFFGNLQQGLLIVGALALLLLGARATVVIVLAIPMSVFIGIGWVDLAGFGLQQMSIVGLVIALGLLVDNAIVVTENVGRYVRQGLSANDAACKGASQVAMAIASGTLTTMLAFFPILLLPSQSGNFMRSMPVTVIFTLFASLLVAIAFTPLVAGRLLKAKEKKAPFLQRKLDDFANGPYQKVLTSTLKHPWLVILTAIAIFVGSLSLFPHIGVSLFPKAEKAAFIVQIELPEGSSFAKTQQVTDDVAEITASYPLVRDIAENVGRGNPRIYYNVFANRTIPNLAQLYVQLREYDAVKIEAMISDMRERFSHIVGARIFVKEFLQGPPAEAPVEIRLEGDNIAQLKAVATDVEQMVRTTQGTVNVDNPISKDKIDLQIDINRNKAAQLGVSLSNIDQTIRASLSGYIAGNYRDELGEDFNILVRAQGAPEPKLAELQKIYISNNQGQLLPLRQLADIKLVTYIPRFRHYNLQRMVHVTADVITGYQTEVITNQIIEKLEAYEFPSGVHYSIGGEQKNRKESFSGMTKAFVIALLGIFAVLVMQFRSFSQPAIIFVAIPFAVSGAFVGLFLTGYTFSFTAFIGLTSLVGIVVNNSIILVDFANQQVSEGIKPGRAIINAAVTRLPPILLTTLTTIGGLLPLTLEGSTMWSPMGWSIIAGLALSTLLTLFVIPVLYAWITPKPKAV